MTGLSGAEVLFCLLFILIWTTRMKGNAIIANKRKVNIIIAAARFTRVESNVPAAKIKHVHPSSHYSKFQMMVEDGLSEQIEELVSSQTHRGRASF